MLCGHELRRRHPRKGEHMNREDIIKLAQDAGIVVTGEAVWRLCEIVAAAERERCAQICDHVAANAVLGTA